MDPHYWPSLYPGIGIAALVGLASGGWRSVVTGSFGGLAGAALSLELNRLLGFDDGLISMIVLVICAAAVARLTTTLAPYFSNVAATERGGRRRYSAATNAVISA